MQQDSTQHLQGAGKSLTALPSVGIIKAAPQPACSQREI